MKKLVKFWVPLINWRHDSQSRIYKNKPEIYWENKVHEQLRGYLTISRLPKRIEYCLMHIKTIKKQRSQNEFYSNIIKS